MLGTQNLFMFMLAGLLLNMTPGADTLYIVGRSAAQGCRAGIVAALGIGAGCTIHILAATIGLSAILAASSTAFTVVKWMGAGYLAYMGISMLFSRSKPASGQEKLSTAPLRQIFWKGCITNALNPKVALFFLAFLPQFIAPDAPQKYLSMLFLGLIFNFNGTLWNLFIAWSSARLSAKLKASETVSKWLNRTCGGLFIYFSVKLALSKN